MCDAPHARFLPYQFDLDHSGRYLVTPSHAQESASGAEDTHAGVLRVYDLWGHGATVAAEVICPGPAISGVSLHPTLVLPPSPPQSLVLRFLVILSVCLRVHTYIHTHT